MTIEVSLTQKYEVVFAPETIEEEVAQNIRMILSSMFFEVPYAREFGLNAIYLDAPILRAQALTRVDIIKQINRYEPRAKVEYVNMDGNVIEGKTTPIVGISLND